MRVGWAARARSEKGRERAITNERRNAHERSFGVVVGEGEIKEGSSERRRRRRLGLDLEGDHRDGGGERRRWRGHGGQAEDAAATGGAGPGQF